jgi:hypothetical protein
MQTSIRKKGRHRGEKGDRKKGTEVGEGGRERERNLL